MSANHKVYMKRNSSKYDVHKYKYRYKNKFVIV